MVREHASESEKAPAAPKAYSYLRFSTPEQSKGDSLRRQTALADEYAKRQGLTLDTELNLRDLGVSAFRGDNAALGALGAFRRAVNDGLVPKGSFLLVENLDRISRQTARKAVRILEEIVEAGVTLVTLNDGKQWTEESLNGADFLLAILLFMRGNEESATKSKRLKAAWVGKRERAARGEVQTTRVPAWIEAKGSGAKDARNATLSLIPDRAALVRRMFEMFLAGTGKEGIAKTFNAERIPTWGAGRGRKVAQHWHKTYVFKILTNPAVTGSFVPHVERHSAEKFSREPQAPIAGYYPAVIDELTFARVQRLIKARRKTVRSTVVASIVAGLARCPKCGSTMTRVFKGVRDPKPKLICRKAKAGGGCDYVSVRLSEVQHALIAGADTLADPPLVDEDLGAQIGAAEAELFHLSEQIESLVSTIERAPSAALSKRLAARETEADVVRDELEKLTARAADSESSVVRLRAKRLSESLTRFDADLGSSELLAAANSALRECVDAVVIDYKAGELRLKWRHGPTSALLYGAGDFKKVRRTRGARE